MILSHSQLIQANAAAATATTKDTMPFSEASSTAHSASAAAAAAASSSSSSQSASLFPAKLYAVLEDAPKQGFDDVICWLPGGASFKVHDPARFTKEVMPIYFNQKKYKSFLRQLNLYSFSRVHHGPHRGGYAHKYFLQGRPDLCDQITKDVQRSPMAHRRVVSSETYSHLIYADTMMDSTGSNTSSASPSPAPQPVFGQHYTPTYVSGEDGVEVSDLDDSFSTRSGVSHGTNIDLSPSALTPLPLEAPVNTIVTQEAIQHILPETTELVQKTPVNEIFHEEPIAFHAMDTQVEKALLSTFVSDDREMDKDIGSILTGIDRHVANDLFAIVNDEPNTAPVPTIPPAFPPYAGSSSTRSPTATSFGMPPAPFPIPGMLATGAFSEFNFPRKVYRMLDDAENNSFYKGIVSWAEEGMAFKVHNKKLFVDKILPIYFDMTQYASFRRQLNMYSFDRKHTSTYSNPFFVRGCPDLLDKITRKSGSKKNDKKG